MLRFMIAGGDVCSASPLVSTCLQCIGKLVKDRFGSLSNCIYIEQSEGVDFPSNILYQYIGRLFYPSLAFYCQLFVETFSTSHGRFDTFNSGKYVFQGVRVSSIEYTLLEQFCRLTYWIHGLEHPFTITPDQTSL